MPHSELRLRTGGEGTYLLGLSVLPREISLTGEQFNGYLKEEGIDGMLAERTRTGALGEAARERYAKHVKAIFQVGKVRSDGYATVLGYTAEIVPLENPYGLKREQRCGSAAWSRDSRRPDSPSWQEGSRLGAARVRELRSVSDSTGVAQIRLASAGRVAGVAFIRMQRPPRSRGSPTT